MNKIPVFLSAALSAAFLAGCQRAGEVPSSPSGAPTPTINQGTPQSPPTTAAARKDGGAPVQGQVDTRDPAQRKAFETPK